MRTALYRHFDLEGLLLYVGISLKPFQRLDQHEQGSHWYNDIASVTVEYFDTRAQAEDAERCAIQAEHPMHNIVHAASFANLPERKLERQTIRPSEKVMFAPRGMRRDIAAFYLGISPSLFDRKRKEGVIPAPKDICGVMVWDKEALDKLFTTNESAPENYWDNALT